MPQNNVYDEIYCLNFANSMLGNVLFLTYNWVFFIWKYMSAFKCCERSPSWSYDHIYDIYI